MRWTNRVALKRPAIYHESSWTKKTGTELRDSWEIKGSSHPMAVPMPCRRPAHSGHRSTTCCPSC